MSVKYGTSYGFVVAETPDEARALHEFITNYRSPQEQEPVTVVDMIKATIDMMVDDPDVNYTNEIRTLSGMAERLEPPVCPTCGRPYDEDEDDSLCWDEEFIAQFFNFEQEPEPEPEEDKTVESLMELINILYGK